MYKGMIRFEYYRLEDTIVKLLAKLHLIKIEGIYPILLDHYGDTIGSYVEISSWKPFVKYLQWYTGYTRKRKITLISRGDY